MGKVFGVGIVRIGGGLGLKVNLESQPRDGVEPPSEIGGVPVRVEVVGSIGKRAA